MAKTSYSTQKKILLNKKSKLFIEACCILQITICLFLVTALFSYNRCDPSWTNSIYIDHIANWSGRFGAWIADVMLMMFGLSSYWMIAPLCRRIVKNYHLITSYHLACNQKKEKREKKKDNWLIEWIPFLLILLSSDGIEALWMWSMKVEIPLIPGGIIGNIIAHYVLHTLGFPAGTVALITTFLTGLSLYFCFSWLWIANLTGSAILFIIHFIRQCIGFGCDLLFYKNFSLSLIGEDKKKYRIKNKNCKQIEIFGHVIDQVEYSQDKKQQTSQFFSHLTDDSFFPTISLLDPVPEQQKSISTDTLEFTSRLIEKKLNDFGVNANVVAAYPGPIITRFEIDPAIGIKGSQITRLSKDLARSLSCVSIRVIETIPDKTYMALEIPNQKRHPITLSEIISSDIYKNSPSILTLSLGKDVSGKPIVTDLSKAPHILVAGTTGSGKSVGINAMILSLLYKASPKQIRLILIDPKMIELSVYEGIPHLLAPVVTDMKLAKSTLDWCIEEIERRYRLMSDFGVRNLASFNKKIKDVKAIGKSIYNSSSLIQEIYEPMAEQPLIVIIIDELADLMIVAGKRVEEQIVRIAQKARAAGIHLILATQRPSVDVITGLIKANIPTRIAFQVSSKIDSRTILDQAGAESLLGMGDMLFLPPGTGYPQRLHGAFVGDEEVHRVVEKLKRNGKPKYVEELLLSCGKKNSDCGIIKNEQKKQVLSQPTS